MLLVNNCCTAKWISCMLTYISSFKCLVCATFNSPSVLLKHLFLLTVYCGDVGAPTILAAAKSLQLCPTLCDSIDGSPPGSPAPGILRARTLGWVAISFSNAWKWKAKVKLCPTLSDPMDGSLPGSSVYGIFQARVMEWGAIAFFGGATTKGIM